jgi:hypothetical protein
VPSQFPRSPKLLKGALVAYQSQFLGPVPNVIVFQYNPEQLSRSLSYRSPTPDYSSGNWGEAREDIYRVQGPPSETINLSVELDAVDQLEQPAQNPNAVEFGLHPALAALELLLYPTDSQILLNQSLLQAGEAQVSAADAPLVLFVWGVSRVLPIRLTNFSVAEQAFDQRLNPIQAKVDLGMQVLTYMELKESSLGRTAYLATQVQKEVLARLNIINNVQQTTGWKPF